MEVEFDYDSIDGRQLKILGYLNEEKIYFKAYQNNKKISKGELTSMDIENIEATIKEYEVEDD